MSTEVLPALQYGRYCAESRGLLRVLGLLEGYSSFGGYEGFGGFGGY
jgi:hypothetical protein